MIFYSIPLMNFAQNVQVIFDRIQIIDLGKYFAKGSRYPLNMPWQRIVLCGINGLYG